MFTGLAQFSADLDFEIDSTWPNPKEGEVCQFHVIKPVAKNIASIERFCEFVWDFGDTGSTYSYGGGKDNDANTAWGWSAGHAYATAGTYTVTCTMYDNAGNSISKTVDITVV